MDITFHYYAVLALARQAGFSADEAQIVATYSQFVDDYTLKQPFPVTDVPDFARVLCSQKKDLLLLHPVTTGFSSWFDMAQLGLERDQKYILTPFHFITPQRPDTEKREELRVTPDYADSGSLLWGCMEQAREDCLQQAEGQAKSHAVSSALVCWRISLPIPTRIRTFRAPGAGKTTASCRKSATTMTIRTFPPATTAHPTTTFPASVIPKPTTRPTTAT